MENETIFKSFCNGLAKKILQDNILSEDKITDIVTAYLKSEIDMFLSSIISELDREILILKKRSQILLKNNHPEYMETGMRLGVLNDRRKRLNIYLASERKERSSSKLKEFLKENGHGQILEDFYESTRSRIENYNEFN